jgi:transposase
MMDLSVPDRTIGLDVGEQWSVVSVVSREGAVVERFRVATRAAALTKRLGGDPGRVVLEVGTHSPWISRLLESRGHEVIVANPRRVRLIGQGENKSDEIDAELLARLGRLDPSLLRPITHRGEQAQRDRMLIQSRDALVRARTQLITTVRGLGKALGIRFPKCTTAAFARRVRETFEDEPFPACRGLLGEIEHLSGSIKALEREIAEAAKRYPEVAKLEAVVGVGTLTALTYVLTLEDPQRFDNSRTVGQFLGLCPRRRQSGATDPQLRITKAGDPLLRRLLVQCANYILGPHGIDCDLRRYGERLMQRGGKAARKRAIVAVARKLAVLLHHLWVHEARYEPLYRTAHEEAA